MILHLDFVLDPKFEVNSRLNSAKSSLFTFSIAMPGKNCDVLKVNESIAKIWDRAFELFEYDITKPSKLHLVGNMPKPEDYHVFSSDSLGNSICNIFEDYLSNEFHVLFKNIYYSFSGSCLYLSLKKNDIPDIKYKSGTDVLIKSQCEATSSEEHVESKLSGRLDSKARNTSTKESNGKSDNRDDEPLAKDSSKKAEKRTNPARKKLNSKSQDVPSADNNVALPSLHAKTSSGISKNLKLAKPKPSLMNISFKDLMKK
eukprot:NODE_259_length_12613_cov_0.311411.p3 type:complete len:258 gc:universal NODE_259_length_12613_cov_0.311411:12226-11453(-)